jgi:2-C-methyl-D-erythritol 4-phosphate cytidylyltransferase
VAAGFRALPASVDVVLVHDGARPCISRALVERVIRAARRDGAAVCAQPAGLTVKQVGADQRVTATLDRSAIWMAQTPQAFRRAWFDTALKRAGRRIDHYPDDAAVVEAAGYPVRVVEGERMNVKVTYPEDLRIVESALAGRRTP